MFFEDGHTSRDHECTCHDTVERRNDPHPTPLNADLKYRYTEGPAP